MQCFRGSMAADDVCSEWLRTSRLLLSLILPRCKHSDGGGGAVLYRTLPHRREGVVFRILDNDDMDWAGLRVRLFPASTRTRAQGSVSLSLALSLSVTANPAAVKNPKNCESSCFALDWIIGPQSPRPEEFFWRKTLPLLYQNPCLWPFQFPFPFPIQSVPDSTLPYLLSARQQEAVSLFRCIRGLPPSPPVPVTPTVRGHLAVSSRRDTHPRTHLSGSEILGSGTTTPNSPSSTPLYCSVPCQNRAKS